VFLADGVDCALPFCPSRRDDRHDREQIDERHASKLERIDESPVYVEEIGKVLRIRAHRARAVSDAEREGHDAAVHVLVPILQVRKMRSETV